MSRLPIHKYLIDTFGTPQIIKVVPEKYAAFKFCFPSVAEKVKRDGGEMILGWWIHQTNFYAELEFHGIWKSTEGKLIDITPKPDGALEILFYEDPDLIYDGTQKNSVRINLTDNSMIDELFEVENALFELLNKDERKFNNGQIILEGKEAGLFTFLTKQKEGLINFINKNQGYQTACFCGSNLNYEDCIHTNTKNHINNLAT